MCKIAVIPKVTDETREQALKLIKVLGVELSKPGGHKDGLGYVAMTKEGNLFGERWLINDDAFIKRDYADTGTINVIKSEFGDIIETTPASKEDVYNSFGVLDDSKVTSIMIHTRLATTDKGLMNCHPFYDPITETTLIHNGVVSKLGLEFVSSTCDSEGIMREYIKQDVMNVPKNIQKVANKLQGYYACGVFSETTDGVKVLDIFKCDRADLIAGYVDELKTLVFCSQPRLLSEAVAAAGLTLTGLYKIRGGLLCRFNALTGKVLNQVKFNPEYVRPKYENPLVAEGSEKDELTSEELDDFYRNINSRYGRHDY